MTKQYKNPFENPDAEFYGKKVKDYKIPKRKKAPLEKKAKPLTAPVRGGTLEYEKIRGEKRKKGFFLLFFLLLDFKLEESNKIIIDLVRKIEQYEQARDMETIYDKVMTTRGMRIEGAKMRSKDDVIQGTITYMPPVSLGESVLNARVVAEFDFKSQSEADKQEYHGLRKIVQQM